MKKKIFVNFILALEFLVLLIYAIDLKYVPTLSSIFPLNYVVAAGAFAHQKLHVLAELIKVKYLVNLLVGYNINMVEVLITLVLVNLAWIIVFYIIFGTIGAIIKSAGRKKRRKVIPEYKLTPTEEKKFSYVNYKKKTGRWVKWTLIIPLVLIATFIFARFDVRNIRAWKPLINNEWGFEIYYHGILPVCNMILEPFNIDKYVKILFTNSGGWGYFDLINKYLVNLAWLEYVILTVASLVILFVWWAFFKLISLIFRKGSAKRLAKKAKRRYIDKMEKQEYRLRKKYKDDAIAKGDEFLRIIEEELSEDALEIAKIKEEKSSRHQKKIDARKKAYLEEIGYGVVDLGVSDEKAKEVKEPIVEREIRYISDADIDIILEEEPVIEIVEEDDMEEVELANKEDDLFFEKYQEDDVDLELVEEHKPEPQDVMDYVKEKAEDKEEVPVVEEVVEEEPVHVEEYVEEVKEDIVEEPIKEEEEVPAPVVEEKVEEAPKKVDPFAAYRDRVNRGHGAKKVQSFKEAGFKEDEMMVRDDGVKVSIKYDPFAKWRNQERKKGYGAKKVPSFKEIQAQKEREAAEQASKAPVAKKAAPKKANPFEAYKGKPKASTASKKVAPVKKEVKPVAKKEEAKPAPSKKTDPFAAYRNKTREKGHGSKKVGSK